MEGPQATLTLISTKKTKALSRCPNFHFSVSVHEITLEANNK